MKTVKISALALAMMGVFATSANAQSVKVNAWEGAYGQVGVGYGLFVPKIGSGSAVSSTGNVPGTSIPATRYGFPATVTQSASASNVNNVNTATASLSAGYNFGINQTWTLGLGASYYPGASSGATGQLSLAPTTITSPVAGSKAVDGGSTTATYNIKNLYSIVVSPGYAIDKDRLAYAKLGYTGATVGLSGPSLAYQTTNLTGWTLGLGYKQMVTESLYAFGEVNYASYGTKNISATLTNSAGTSLQGMTVSGNGTDILVGVGYRF
jgi:outer membrane immunogenic protein